MSDRYDPKLSARPPGGRRPDAAAPDDDPLAELARIVTGRTTMDPAPDARGRSSSATPDAAQEADLANDLESELLSDLQASFAALGVPFEGEETPARPEPELPEFTIPDEPPESVSPHVEGPRRAGPEADFEQSVEDVLAELEGVTRAAREPSPEPVDLDDGPDLAPEIEPTRYEPPHEEHATPPPPPIGEPRRQVALPRRSAPGERPAAAERTSAERPPLERRSIPERPAPPSLRPPHGERPEAPERPNLSRLRLRPGMPPVRPVDSDDNEPPPRQERMDRALRAPESASAGRFAPPRAATRLSPDVTPEPRYDDEAAESFGEAPELDDPNAVYEDEFSLDDLDTAAFAPEDDLPPFPEEELAGMKRRRSGRALTAVGGVLVVAAIGAAGFFLTQGDSGNGSPPPIITADGEPSKVFPEEGAAGETDQQGKLIYDRVDDSGGGNETTLVATGNDPIAEVSPSDEQLDDNPITRVIIPGGPGIDGPLEAFGDGDPTGDGMVVAEVDPSADTDPSLGPKKVRTVVVRPDGTIVSSEAVEEGSEPIPESVDAAPVDEFSNLGSDARTDMDAVLEGQELPVIEDPLGATGPVEEAVVEEVTPEPGTVPAEEEAVAVVEEIPDPPAVAEPVTPRATPAPAPARPAQPTIVATTGDANGPIDLTPGSSGGTASPQAGSGGALVQVSAQRSEDAARESYRSLQSRYPNILGPYQAAIIRADLGDRGVYYRVRIGPFSGNDATRLCNDLKSAGGDCIVAR